MEKQIKKQLELINNYQSKRFLLAVSGGVDSMVLLDLFSSLSLHFEVAHCNFQLREEDSNKDEELVKKTCLGKNIPLHTKRFNTQKIIDNSNESTQMVARDLRYNWFKELLQKQVLDYIVTAHHLNDQIETFFINLSRGSGLDGLTAMETIKGNVFRPLLNRSKEELIAYSSKNQVKYREDKSNQSNVYKRNLIRNKIIPLFKELNPSFEQTMKKNLHHISDSNSFLNKKIEQNLSDKIITTASDKYYIDFNKLLKKGDVSLHLFHFFYKFGFNSDQIKQLETSLKSSSSTGKYFVSKSHEIIIDREYLILSPVKNEHEETLEIKKSDNLVTYPIHLSFENRDVCDNILFNDNTIAKLDEAKLTYPLILRKWKNGDTFTPFGMKGRKKKVSDLLIDLKVDSLTKRNVFVLLSQNKICWVIGYRISENYKITDKTTKIKHITFKK